MLNSLFDKKTAKQFDSIAKQKAKLHKKEEDAVSSFMCSNSKDMIVNILDIAAEHGHPKEQESSKELLEKYNNGMLEFDDIITLDTLYKSNYKYFENKDDSDE